METKNQTSSVTSAPMPIMDVSKYIKQKYGKNLTTVILIAVILETLIIASIVIFFGLELQLIFNLSFIPAILVAAAYVIARQKAIDAFFEQFASVNNFSFQKTGLPSNLAGSLFFIGTGRVGRDLISGIFQNIPFNLLNYQYTIGSGKSSHTYVYTTFRLNFASSLPPIFLSPKAFYFGDISRIAREKLQLEGDFDKYFDLWTEKGFEIEALQFMAPDVMAKIMDNWGNFSLEFVADQIYIYAGSMITKDQDLENMYQFVQYLIFKIIPYSKEIKGDIGALDQYYNKQ
jgi:hypothetical protein